MISDLLLALASLFAGAMVTWWFARDSSRELKVRNDELREDNAALRCVVEKLPSELHAVIANDPRATLTLEQLAQLAATVGHLQSYIAPRILTADQMDQLIAGLRGMSPKSIKIVSTGGDDEADRFRDQIAAAFAKAGWPVSSGAAMAAMNVNGVSLDYFSGHTGHFPSTGTPGEDTLRLQSALEQAGVKARTRSLPENERDLHWLLSVGQKPRA